MTTSNYPFDGIIFDCDGTLILSNSHGSNHRENSHVCRWVRFFSKELPMAVGSGGTREDTARKLKHIDIYHLFDVVVTISDCNRNKPAPDIFLEAAKRLNISTDCILVVEDSESGVEAARRAGIQCVHVSKVDEYFGRFEPNNS